MRAQAHEAELARIAEQEAREAAERQRKMEEAAAKQRAKEEEVERRKAEVRPGAEVPARVSPAREGLAERLSLAPKQEPLQACLWARQRFVRGSNELHAGAVCALLP